MFDKIIDKINRKRHYGLNVIVWDWLQFHIEESGMSFLDYMYKETHKHYVIVNLDGKSMIYENGFASYAVFDGLVNAEDYVKENNLKNVKIVDEVSFLRSLGLDTKQIFTYKRFKKALNRLFN